VRPAAPDPPEIFGQLWEGFGGEYGWDIGANCGQTIPVMGWLFARFTCFEPCAASCAYARDAWPGRDIRLLAVSDHDGEVTLAFPAAEQRETGQLVTPGTPGMEWSPPDWGEVELVTVPCRTADSLAAELGTPDFIKVDTEGHERLVLCGAGQILAGGRTSWLIEFHSLENKVRCQNELRDWGYVVQVVRHPHYPEGSQLWSGHGWIRALAPQL